MASLYYDYDILVVTPMQMQTITVIAPPSKSLSHRSLICAALADGESRLEHVLESDDSARTIDCLKALGADIERLAPGSYKLKGLKGRIVQPEDAGPLSLFVGESGTTCRLLTAVVATGSGCFRVHGAGRMHERPIGELSRALTSLGTSFDFLERPGCPPFVLTACGLDASHLPKATIAISCAESSQYLSGLLLAAPLVPDGLRILLEGEKAVSWPYVNLTLETMATFGVNVEVQKPAIAGALLFKAPFGHYQARALTVEGDYSGASYFLAAGAIGPAAVQVMGLKRDSLQADAALLPLLERMGAQVKWDGDAVTVSPAPLHGIEADMGQCPDIVPTLAALAARAKGRSVFGNAAHLAIKESDRLQAPARELGKIGCRVQVLPDSLVIDPPQNGLAPLPPGQVFSAHNDHRMAMSMALLGLAGPKGDGIAVPLD
ncbi:3-phosphoshikimate 1-carboxyvinyltransferase, partial [Desulfovibrio sp. OttesenSCG-928-M14]|nr:3-phosphoshikimate 1-carboxyvinyltransferase [Desulfovibrio sp. OttesenSCG-928-M14]